MKILFLSSNPITDPLQKWLRDEACEDVSVFGDKLSVSRALAFAPDWIVSYNYPYIIGPEIIHEYQTKIINLHISYLPWNRGADPNFWSFIDQTPKGVSIHQIDQGLDTGPILAQMMIHFDESQEDLKSSYNVLHREIRRLFQMNWEGIATSRLRPKTQVGDGSSHRSCQFDEIRQIVGEKIWKMKIFELREVLRHSQFAQFIRGDHR